MAYSEQQVVSRRDWSDNVFSFTTTRPEEFDFENGEFVTLGMRIENKLIPRAYSIVSSKDEQNLEFLSIAVPNGPLTSHLVNIEEGSNVWINQKSTGSLTLDHVQPGRHLYLIATGTGVAPFVSLVRGGEVFKQFEKVILVHTVRYCNGLAFRSELEEMTNNRFLYVPTVTREAFENNKRGADMFRSGELSRLLDLPLPDARQDRVMLCGNPAMNHELRAFLEQQGWQMTDYKGTGNFTIEQAFVLSRED